MEIGINGIEIISRFEGLRTQLYNDPDGHCTIGIGHLVHIGNCNGGPSEQPFINGITEQQAYDLFRENVKSYSDCVEQYSRPLKQNEFDALTSFCYNVGQGGYIYSSVRKAVNNNGDVRAALMQYITGVSGTVYQGLIERRKAEADLFYRGDEMFRRLNGIAPWWENREISNVSEGVINVYADFPAAPTGVPLLLELFLSPNSTGIFTLKDGNGNYAGQVSPSIREAQIICIPLSGQLKFSTNANVKINRIGIVGYWA